MSDRITSEEVRKKQEERDKKRLRRKQDDFRWILSDPRGRRFIWEWLEEAGAFHSTFSRNALEMAFNEGQRNGALRVLKQIEETKPESYTQMQREYKGLQKEENGEVQA